MSRDKSTVVPFINIEDLPSLPHSPPPSPTPFQSSDESSVSVDSSNEPDLDISIITDLSTEEDEKEHNEEEPRSDEASADEPVKQKLDFLPLITRFKIVFDNIDKNVKPRHMRSDRQTNSLHYVHAYAVKDRVDFSATTSELRGEVNIFDVLPNAQDYTSLKASFTTLVSRLIVKYLTFFSKDYKPLTCNHIPHKYSKEMSIKSDIVSYINFDQARVYFLLIFQVPLGILPKSEMNYEDMTEILEHFHTYVPSVNYEVSIPERGTVQDKHFLTTLVGGDYLSVARARGAQIIRSTSELEQHTLGGLLPVAEDWHAKVCLMEVSFIS